MLLFILTAILLFTLYYAMRQRQFMIGIISVVCLLILSAIVFFNLLILIADRGEIHEVLVLVIVYALIPLVFFVTMGWLIFNSRVMQTREGRSVTAKLSAALGLNLFIVMPLFFLTVSDVIIMPTFLSIIFLIFALLDIVFTCIFISYLLYSFFYQIMPIRQKVDYIIILGAGLMGEKVTPLLKSRLDRAIQQEMKQKTPIKYVVSEGQGPDEVVSEAYAMGQYLLSQNIPSDQIIYEDQSTTTLENMRFSKQMIEKDWQADKRPKILFSTSNYHVLRSAFYAKKAKLKAEGIGAPVALYFLPSALIREFIALLVKYKYFTGAIILLVVLFVAFSFSPF